MRCGRRSAFIASQLVAFALVSAPALYTVLWNPDVNPRNATFGYINQDRNNPRAIQLGLRLTF